MLGGPDLFGPREETAAESLRYSSIKFGNSLTISVTVISFHRAAEFKEIIFRLAVAATSPSYARRV
jgi:hypothetical protein